MQAPSPEMAAATTEDILGTYEDYEYPHLRPRIFLSTFLGFFDLQLLLFYLLIVLTCMNDFIFCNEKNS